MRPTVDEMKLARDGHLWAIKPYRRKDLPPPRWLIERDEAGMPIRAWWNGDAVREWERQRSEDERCD